MGHEGQPLRTWATPNDELATLLRHLLQANIRYLDWAEYWYNDEPHQGQFALLSESLHPVNSPSTHALPDAADHVLWHLAQAFPGGYGSYRLDAIDGTVTQLGQAHYEVAVTPIASHLQEQIALAAPLPQQRLTELAWERDEGYPPESIDPVNLDCFVEVLTAHDVDRAEWMTYWHEDACHIEGDRLFDTAGADLTPDVEEYIHNYWGSREGQVRHALEQAGAPDLSTVFWFASHAFATPYGHFRLQVRDRLVRQIGHARFNIRTDPWQAGAEPQYRLWGKP